MLVTHYGDVIMDAIASQIISLTIVYSTVYSDADQRKHPSSTSLAFVWGIHRGPANSPHKWPVTRKMFPFGDVIMQWEIRGTCILSPMALMHISHSESCILLLRWSWVLVWVGTIGLNPYYRRRTPLKKFDFCGRNPAKCESIYQMNRWRTF